MTVEQFVNMLSQYPDSDNYENPYLDERKRNNLIIYLKEMKKLNPTILFVGEAPGYLGCSITGIPFTDERVLTSKEYSFVPGCGLYSLQGKQKERSAKAMWDVMQLIYVSGNTLPLMWNSFPFHPFDKTRFSNRAPFKTQIENIGIPCLHNLLKVFDIKQVYAIGLKSFGSLTKMNISDKFVESREISYIRHPSYGGKKICHEKIKSIFRIDETNCDLCNEYMESGVLKKFDIANTVNNCR